MSNSNQLFNGNVSLFNRLNSSEKQFLIDKNLSYNHKRTCGVFNNSIKEHSYAKMIIESYDTLSKSQAIEFLRQALSTESKVSLLDAMKDKVTLSTEEIDELVPSTDSSSSGITNVSSFDNLSYLSLLIPQQRSPHIFTSFNNAAQSTRTSSNRNKRSSLLRGLFGRQSSKKRASIVKQPLKVSQQANKKRVISGGDQVKLSSTKINHVEQPYQSKHHYDINVQGDTIANPKATNNKVQLSFHGLRYDFKQIKDTSTINPLEIKRSFKDNCSIPTPFASHSSFIQDKSLSSLSDPTSMRQHTNEKKQSIQSAHTVGSIPKMKTTNTTLEKISFNGDQHKYHTQTPHYHYPKCLSAMEILAKQYSLPMTSQNSTGLFWYSANQQTMNRSISFSKRVNTSKQNNRFDSSSDSRDTSSSSNSSSTSSSTKKMTNNTSSKSSTTSSSSQKTSKSSSSSTISSSQSEQKAIKTIGQYNRNQNDKDDLIRIDLTSSTSQTSTSTSNTSVQPCHQRSISRKQLSTISSTTKTSDNDSSSSSASSTSSLTMATNNNNKLINSVDQLTNKVTFNIPLVSNLFSSVNNRTIGKFKVKRQRIEPNIIT